LRAVIFANGLISDDEAARQALRPDDWIVAADGGGRHCLRLGLTPALVVGDFDSLSAEELARLMELGAEAARYPSRKDFTDLELALRHARQSGATEIILLGGLGQRWDQTLANLLLPASAEFAGVQITILDGNQEIHLLRGGQTLEIQGAPGDIVSLIPLGADVHGIRTQGLEYRLDGDSLLFGGTRGVSNALIDSVGQVRLEQGLLMVVAIH
jgi:thiamine pyrophosphokinase